MSRRLIAIASLVALAAAGCGPGEVRVSAPPLPEGEFARLVVDAEADSGAGLSLTTDADGNPHLAYVRVEKPPAEGEPPPVFDPLAPVLPAVMHAHLVEGVWTHSPVAEETGITPDDETAIALDPDGVHHVAWTEDGDVRYTSNAGGSFAEAETVLRGDATGLAITASADGVFLSFYDVQDGVEGPAALVRAAARIGDAWQVETAAEADPEAPMTTGIGIGADGPVVAYGSAGETMLARRVSDVRWQSEPIAQGGLGVSLDVDADGNPHVAYYDGATVTHAHSIDGSPWDVSEVGDAGAAPSETWATSIALADDGVHWVAYDSGDGPRLATNADGDFAQRPLEKLAGTVRPRIGAGAEGAVYVAAYDPAVPSLVLAASGIGEQLLAAPPETGGTETTEPTTEPTGPPPCEPEGAELAVVAENIAFDTDCLAAPAGEDFTIEFENRDTAPHNVAIYQTSAADQDVFVGEVFPGPETQTYEVPGIADPGQLYFQCDVHPNMNGTFVVQ